MRFKKIQFLTRSLEVLTRIGSFDGRYQIHTIKCATIMLLGNQENYLNKTMSIIYVRALHPLYGK